MSENHTVLQPGDHIAWKYGVGIAEGVVVSVHPEPTEILSKQKRIKRNGTEENPAIIIKHASGNDVLKLASEVQKTRK